MGLAFEIGIGFFLGLSMFLVFWSGLFWSVPFI